MGRVPNEGVRAMCELAPGRQMKVHAAAIATAKATLAGAEQVWAVRNEVAQGWEHEVGISETKKERSKTEWMRAHAQRPKGRRGPSPKALQDLADNTRRQRESDMHRTRMVNQHGPDKGKGLHLTWMSDRRARERGSGVGTQTSIVRWIEGLTGDERTAWSNPAGTAHVQHIPSTLPSTFGDSSRTTKDADRCTYGTCTEKGVRLAWGCRGTEGYLRCEACSRYSCRGSRSMCQCARDNTSKRGRGKAHTTATTRQMKIDKMVHQHDLWQQRARRTPVRIWVHSQHGQPRQVGEVTHVIRRNGNLRLSWWRAVADEGHPWRPVEEIYMKVGEEEVSVLLHKVTWGMATSEGELESPAGSDDEGDSQVVNRDHATCMVTRAHQGEGTLGVVTPIVSAQDDVAGPGPATMMIWAGEGYTEAEVCCLFGSTHMAGPGFTHESGCMPWGSEGDTGEWGLQCPQSATPRQHSEGDGDGKAYSAGGDTSAVGSARGGMTSHDKQQVPKRARKKTRQRTAARCQQAPAQACNVEQHRTSDEVRVCGR